MPLGCTKVRQQLPREGVFKFYCSYGSMRGDIVMQNKDIFQG